MSIETKVRRFLEHYRLPLLFYEKGSAVTADLMVGRSGFIEHCYKKLEEVNPDYQCPYTKEDFRTTIEVYGNMIMITRVVMPTPEKPGLCRAVYFVRGPTRRNDFYFTSELVDDGSYAICGWSPFGEHIQFGESPYGKDEELEEEQELKVVVERYKQLKGKLNQLYMILSASRSEKYCAARGVTAKDDQTEASAVIESAKPASNELPQESLYPRNLIADILQKKADGVTEDQLTPDKQRGLGIALAVLKDREREIILKRYREGKTLAQIACEQKISRERVRQIIKKTLCILRQPTCLELITRGDTGYFAIKSEQYQKKRSDWTSKREEIENKPIEELDFTVRTYGCLKRAGIETVGDILKIESDGQLRQIRNLCLKSKREIAAILNQQGISNDLWEAIRLQTANI